MRKVSPGDKLAIPASTYNAFIDAAGKAKESQHGLAGTAGRQLPDQDIVLVQNTSGADVDRFGVLALDGPVITPTDNPDEFKSRPMFKGVTPTDTDRGWFVILLEPIPAGDVGRGCLAGITIAKVDVTVATHGSADVKVDDRASLESCGDGSAVILWRESGTGVKWAVVRMGRDLPWYPGMIIMWSGLVANIPDGWALCDGGYYCIRHGIKDHGCGSGYTTVNLSARMVMCLAVGGQAGENTIGDTGGYRKHGVTENNHSTHAGHSLNYHTIPAHDAAAIGNHTANAHTYDEVAACLQPHTKQQVSDCIADHTLHTHEIGIGSTPEENELAAGTDYDAQGTTDVNIDGGFYHNPAVTGSGLVHAGQSPASLPHAISAHYGSLGHDNLYHSGDLSHDPHTDTDNRPYYYVLAFIERIR